MNLLHGSKAQLEVKKVVAFFGGGSENTVQQPEAGVNPACGLIGCLKSNEPKTCCISKPMASKRLTDATEQGAWHQGNPRPGTGEESSRALVMKHSNKEVGRGVR